MNQSRLSISEQIRNEFLRQAELGQASQYRATRVTGISQSALSRFVNGADMYGERLTAVARYLGMMQLELSSLVKEHQR